MSFFDKKVFALLFGAAVFGSGFVSPAYGDEEDGAETIEEVVVTGSRIPRSGFDTLYSVNVVDAEFIEQRAYTNVADALNEVTSFGAPGNSTEGNQNSYSIGQNFVNFFGLGSQRTLTLVNGKRFVSSSTPSLFTSQAPGLQVDLNAIPTSMVERIETIAVGGAPIYGADAIAGTVNVILKDDFEGLEISTSYGEALDEGDLEETTFELLWGGNFADGRGNVVVGIEINDLEGAIESDRAHLNEGWQWRTSAPGSEFQRQLIRKGTANIVAKGGVITPVIPGLMLPNFGLGAVGTNDDGSLLYLAFQPDGSLGPYNVGSPTPDAVWSIGGEGLFLPDVTSLYTPLNRKIATAFATYEVSDNVELYGELYIVENDSTELVNQSAYQSGFFGEESAAMVISADHPLLTDAAKATLADVGLSEFSLHRASTDLGDRRGNARNNLWRGVLGARGSFELAERSIDWDVAWIKGRSETDTESTELINANFFYAVDVVDTATGPQCRVVADPSSRPADPGAPFGIGNRQSGFDSCVPLDIFGQGRASQEALDYVSAQATSLAVLEQDVISVNANTTVMELPAGDLGVAVGFEHREEAAYFATDGVTKLGLGRSVPIDATQGRYETDEWNIEIFAPLVSPDMDIPLIHSAILEGAFRQVDNDLAGKADVHTIGGRWAPIPDVEFRGNVTRSVRAPAITELFLPLSGTNSFANDPCDQANVGDGPSPANRRANCIAAGIDVESFSSNVRNASVQGLNGGNDALANEIADATTFGVVLRPRWVENLSVAIDYVDIEIEDAIESFTLTQIMESCYDANTFPNDFCGQFTRGADGQLPPVNAFQSGFVNAGLVQVRGTTVEFDWNGELANWPGFKNFDNPGYLRINGNMFFPDKDITVVLGSETDGLDLPTQAKQQVQINFTYGWNDLTVLWQTRFIGSTVVETDIAEDRYPDSTLGSVDLHNLGVSYQFNERVRVNVNINNVFDHVPEISAIARGYDSSYDNIGRYIRAGVKVSL
ncbi:MAG: hypothetical protein CMQ40_09685 [Gammaproteobacteria bacterium]|nr:hypothetical protein [Gammaproteobacteria bacterium]